MTRRRKKLRMSPSRIEEVSSSVQDLSYHSSDSMVPQSQLEEEEYEEREETPSTQMKDADSYNGDADISSTPDNLLTT